MSFVTMNIVIKRYQLGGLKRLQHNKTGYTGNTMKLSHMNYQL